MGETVSNTPLTTVVGNYYNGLTRTAAKEQGYDIKLFDKIDANDGEKNGTLSLEDIISRRNTECSSRKILGYTCAVAAGVAAFCGPVGWTIATIAFFAGAGNLYVANEENKETLKYS